VMVVASAVIHARWAGDRGVVVLFMADPNGFPVLPAVKAPRSRVVLAGPRRCAGNHSAEWRPRAV
jgi:hypothetical protein